MADNVNVRDSESAEFTVAADEIGGVKHQRVKVQHGADGSATDVSSASPLPVESRDADLDCVGYEQNTVDATTAEAFGSIPGTATLAEVVPSAAVRFRQDGTDPTASVGMPLAAGQPYVFNGELAAVKFISQSGNAVLNINYFRVAP